MRVAALSVRRSVAPLHRASCSKSLLCIYSHVLPRLWRISAGGAASVQSLKGSEMMLGTSPFETTTTLATSGLDHLQLTVEHVYLRRNVEDMGVRFVVAGNLGGQSPVVCAVSQLNGLVVGR